MIAAPGGLRRLQRDATARTDRHVAAATGTPSRSPRMKIAPRDRAQQTLPARSLAAPRHRLALRADANLDYAERSATPPLR